VGKCIRLSKVLLVLSLTLPSLGVQAQTSEPFDVVAPTKLNGRQKAYSNNFSASAENAPFKLIVINGTGNPIFKQICKGGLIVKLLCELQNTVVELRMVKERVAEGEIILNGNKIVTPKNLNLNVASIEMNVALLANNKIEIKTAGFATSSITYQIQGVKVTTPQILTILSPIEGANINEDKITVTGVINSNEPNLKLIADNTKAEIPIDSGKTFLYEFDYLQTGRNTLGFTLYSGQTKLDFKILSIIYLPTDSNGQMVSSTGGSVEVLDSNNELYGTSVNIPAGALTSSEFIVIKRGDSWGPNISYIYEDLGATTTVSPNFLYFGKNVTLTFPFHPEKLPQGADYQNIKILGYDESGWKIIAPKTISTESVSIETDIFNYYAYKVVIEKPIANGEIQILSNIGGASIYLDGVDAILRVPTTLSQISEGTHTVRIYAEGYNEVTQTISYPSQKRIYIELQPQDPSTSTVSLDPSINENIITEKETMTISGNVSSSKINEAKDFVILSLGNEEFVQKLKKNGKFSFIISIPKGRNKMRARATVDGKTSLSKEVTVRKKINVSNIELDRLLNSEGSGMKFIPESKQVKSSVMTTMVAANNSIQEILFTAQWVNYIENTGTFNVHIYDPSGAHASADNPNGIEGATYQRTPTSITFRLPKPKEGNYRFEYDSIDMTAYNAFAKLSVNGKELWSGDIYSFGTGSYTGMYITQAYIQPLKLVGIDLLGFGADPYEPSRPECKKFEPNFCTTAGFTTGPNRPYLNSDMAMLAFITDALADTVKFRIREVNLGITVEAAENSYFGGGTVYSTFHAKNNPLDSLTSPTKSKPLIYEVVAYTEFEESKPAYIVQSARGQIRQEFEDKRIFMDTHPSAKYPNGFQRPSPELFEIQSSAAFPSNTYYTFQKMISFADFENFGLGMSRYSYLYSQATNDAYREIYPNTILELKSGWRNPRRSDLQDVGSLQSYHQIGDAVDFVPPQTIASKQNLAVLRDQKLIELCKIAFEATVDTDVIYHDWHVHIEPYNGIARVPLNKGCISKLPATK
jgi:hypothetical protein